MHGFCFSPCVSVALPVGFMQMKNEIQSDSSSVRVSYICQLFLQYSLQGQFKIPLRLKKVNKNNLLMILALSLLCNMASTDQA